MVVVLPAPFGPTKPKMWPESNEKEMLSTATVLPNSFRKFLTSTFIGCRPGQGFQKPPPMLLVRFGLEAGPSAFSMNGFPSSTAM